MSSSMDDERLIELAHKYKCSLAPGTYFLQPEIVDGVVTGSFVVEKSPHGNVDWSFEYGQVLRFHPDSGISDAKHTDNLVVINNIDALVAAPQCFKLIFIRFFEKSLNLPFSAPEKPTGFILIV